MKADTAIFTAYDEHTPRDSAVGEKMLMQAILRGAMEDLSKSGDVQRQAKYFFLSNETTYLYSFLSICTHLGLCPKTVRGSVGLVSN